MSQNPPVETDISVRDVVRIITQHKPIVFGLPVGLALITGIASFFIKNTYASTSTVNVTTAQVKAELDSKIQVSGQNQLSFEGYKSIAYGLDVLESVRSSLAAKSMLPTKWQEKEQGLIKMAEDFKLKDVSPKMTYSTSAQPVLLRHQVTTESANVAATATNFWTDATIKKVNDLPTERSKQALAAIQTQVKESERQFLKTQQAWEAFNRSSSLSLDRQELDSKVAERVQIDKDLADATRELAVIASRLRKLEDETRAVANDVSIESSPDQLAVSNKSLEQAKQSLAAATDRDRQAWQQASSQLEDFQRNNRLGQWRSEIDALTGSLTSNRVRILAIQTQVAEQSALLSEAKKQLGLYKNQTQGLGIDELVSGLTVAEAKNLVKRQVDDAKKRKQEAEAAYKKFQDASQLDIWNDLLSGFTRRSSDITLRLSSLSTEKNTKEARLAELEAQVAKEPKLIELDREITSDPAVAAAIKAGSSNLQDLVGLKLKNQEANPIYTDLLAKVISQRVDLKTLEVEEKSLLSEQKANEPKMVSLKDKISAAQIEAYRINNELAVSRENYGAVYNYQQKLVLAASQNSKLDNNTVRDSSGDVLALRNQVVGYTATLAGLKAESAQLNSSISQYTNRITDLKSQVATQERNQEQITNDYNTTKAVYQAMQNRYAQLKNVSGANLRFRSANTEYLRLSSAFTDAQVDQALAEARSTALQSRLGQLDKRIGDLRVKVSSGEVRNQRVNQDYDFAKEAYNALAQKANGLKIEIASSQNMAAQVLSSAFPDYQKVGPKRGIMVVLAGILGLIAAFAWVFIKEALEPRRSQD